MITSGNVDKAALGLLISAAVAMFAPISTAGHGFFNTLGANFLPVLAELFRKILKKLPRPSACIVLSTTTIDFFSITNRTLPN